MMIKVTRAKKDGFGIYKIYADDVCLGEIKAGETKEFGVKNGSHAICAKTKTGWYRSPTLHIDVDSAEIELEVGYNPSATGSVTLVMVSLVQLLVFL